MNALLDEMNLRELPSWLVDSYRKGTCTPEEKRIVEELKNLPVNFVKFLTTPEEDSEEGRPRNIERLMKLAEEAMVRSGYKPEAPFPEPEDAEAENMIEPAAGQIWSVKTFIGESHKLDVLPIAREQYVFLLTNPVNLTENQQPVLRKYTDDRFVEVLPVSIHTEFANRYDMIIPEGNDILGVEFMIETEINSRLLARDLDVCHGAISQEEAEKLLNLYFHTHDMEYDYELLGTTNTGEENEESGFPLDEFKQIEFANSQIIAEPVEALEERLAELGKRVAAAVMIRVIGKLSEFQHTRVAAAVNNIEVAALEPGEVQEIFNDPNIMISVNRYDQHGYYFNVIVAAEVCKETFDFRVSSLGPEGIAIERTGRKPGEYFFGFDSEMKTGLYKVTLVSGGQTLFDGEIVLEFE